MENFPSILNHIPAIPNGDFNKQHAGDPSFTQSLIVHQGWIYDVKSQPLFGLADTRIYVKRPDKITMVKLTRQ